MGQTPETGQAGNNFGHRMGEHVAKRLGTQLLETGTGSNEAIYDGERVILKSAHKNTSSIGVTINVLETVQAIIATFEDKNKSSQNLHHYTIYRVSFNWYKEHMKPSRANERASRTTMMVTRSSIRKEGKVIGEFECDF
ncbi:hypothetical protein LI82_04130 [Methanococcoides methylutens]|uniref:Uncharacterized protein n=1 Tax=Methanococcoides methylutens TaxID=2226 RepID=A0A099T4Y3_METMT|nr:hypothetical protein [Methanococcoides methylutens]KGK99218.1 hypothetical protein LI82_04130 [Methanococcoides methylutens]